MELRAPQTQEEFEKYYDLRFRVLRKPWNQPKGSEKESDESNAVHVMAYDSGRVIGVGMVQSISETEAQIRYMATDPNEQGKGIASKVLSLLEQKAIEKGITRVFLNARENVIGFYEKSGYVNDGPSHKLFGEIQHFKMIKSLIG